MWEVAVLERDEGILSGPVKLGISYESGSEMEACGCRVPYRTLAYLIACPKVVVGGGISCASACSFNPCLI